MTVTAAFDLGLKTTGTAWADDSDIFVCPNVYHRSPMSDRRITARLHWWQHTFRHALEPHAGSHVAVEAPFVHPKHMTGAMRLLELHGVFRAVCADAGIAVTTVTPSELKKWATGKGNATKTDMIAAAIARGLDEPQDDNEADAWLLLRMVREAS